MTCFDKKSSARGRRPVIARTLLVLGLLLRWCSAAAQEPAGCVSAGGSEGLRPKENILSDLPDTIVFRFAPERRMFWADYKGNATAIDSFTRSVRQHKAAIEAGDVKVRVLGFCSSFGTRKERLAVAKNRSNQVKSYFIVHEGLKEEHFRTTNSARQWREMTDVIAVAYLYPSGAAAAQPAEEPAGEDEEMMRPEQPVAPDPAEEPAAAVGTTSAEPSPSVYEALQGCMIDPVVPRHRWAVKTNVAYLAATVANIGVEYSFGKRYSIDIPVIYSPYTVARDYRIRFLAVQPEFRCWLKTPMKGHFFGLHLNIGAFNISVDDKNRYQSPDGFYGAGLSYGYALPFARRWAAEFTVGAGYVYTKYDTYYNIPDGARFETGTPYNYWGLTKAGVSLVYRFGK